MTALTRNPSNPNILHPNKFILNFSRVPNLQYFCQTVIVPGITISEIPKANPFVDLYSPGDKAMYDLLTVTFMVDEELFAWKEIHDWIRAMAFPNNFEEYANLQNSNPNYLSQLRKGFAQFSDIDLTVLSASNNPIFRFKFKDAFPISISPLPLSTTESPNNIVTADATFRFSWYDIETL